MQWISTGCWSDQPLTPECEVNGTECNMVECDGFIYLCGHEVNLMY